MRHNFLIATGFAMMLTASPALAADATYDITEYYSDQAVSGTTSGTHLLSLAPGTYGGTMAKGGSSPVVVAFGQIAKAYNGFLRMNASYSYTLLVQSLSPAAQALFNAVVSNGLGSSVVVGHLSGALSMGGSGNSDSSVLLTAGSENGSQSLYASCDAGTCNGLVSVTPGISTPFSLDIALSSFGYGCLVAGCGGGPGATPYLTVRLDASAGVGNFTDGAGLPVDGEVYSMLDPVFTFDSAGLQSLGLDPTAYSVLSSATDAVPEPTHWGMLIAGLGMAGAALRRRRGSAPAVDKSRRDRRA